MGDFQEGSFVALFAFTPRARIRERRLGVARERRDGGVHGCVQVRSEVFLAKDAKLWARYNDVLWRTNHVRDGVATVGRVR